MPWSGPRFFPAAISSSAFFAWAIASEGDDAAELGIELLDAAKVNLREALGGELALLDPAGELRDGGEGDVGFVGGQRAGIGFGADELIALRAGGLPGENGTVTRERREHGFEDDGAGTGAALVDRGKVYAPGLCSEGAVGGG